jgi:hypothetical protein
VHLPTNAGTKNAVALVPLGQRHGADMKRATIPISLPPHGAMKNKQTAKNVREHTVRMVQYLSCHQLLHHQLTHHQLRHHQLTHHQLPEEHAGTINAVVLVRVMESHGADIMQATTPM